MFSNRRTGHPGDSTEATQVIETLRSADHSARAGGSAADHHKPGKSEDEKVSLFWRVFGGTILSVCALAGLTLYTTLTNNISELRGEVGKLNEAKADAAKKDELNVVRTQMATFTEYRREIDSLKERAAKYRAEVDEAKKEAATALDQGKKELAGQLEAVRKEQAATTDVLKKDVAALELLRERLVAVAADVKAARDDAQKVRQDVDKNQAYDLERRDRRDVQMKQLDEALKEIQKNLLETREKVARLEGQQQAKVSAPTPPAAEVGPPAPPKPAGKPKSNAGPRPATPTGDK